MAQLLSFLVLLLWFSEGQAFSVYQAQKRDKFDNRRFLEEENHKLMLNKKELCLLKNCFALKGFGFVTCYLTCMDENSKENWADISDEEHPRRQVDPLQSCIEAKCSRGSAYLACVYSQCIMGLRLGFKSLDKRGHSIVGSSANLSESNEETESSNKPLKRMRKKSWNDPSVTCQNYHCGPYSDNLEYVLCVTNNCGNSYERR